MYGGTSLTAVLHTSLSDPCRLCQTGRAETDKVGESKAAPCDCLLHCCVRVIADRQLTAGHIISRHCNSIFSPALHHTALIHACLRLSVCIHNIFLRLHLLPPVEVP